MGNPRPLFVQFFSNTNFTLKTVNDSWDSNSDHHSRRQNFAVWRKNKNQVLPSAKFWGREIYIRLVTSQKMCRFKYLLFRVFVAFQLSHHFFNTFNTLILLILFNTWPFSFFASRIFPPKMHRKCTRGKPRLQCNRFHLMTK